MIRENMWKVSANDVIFHGCFWVPVPVPSTCWLRQSLLCGSWCRMCVRHLQLVYNWIVVQITKKNRDVAHICCLGTIRRNKKHLGLLFGLLLAIRLSNLAVKTYLWFVSPFILSGMFRCRAVWGSTRLALTSCKPIPQHDYNFCPGKTALNCGPQSETTQNAAPKNFKTAVYDGVYHVLPPYTSLCRVHIYVYRIYICIYMVYIYIYIYIYIAHDLPPYVKPLDHMRPDADPEPLVRGLLLMESVASAPIFFRFEEPRLDNSESSWFTTMFTFRYTYIVYI